MATNRISFPGIQFIVFSHPNTWRAPQLWYKRIQLVLQLVQELGKIHMTLVLWICRMQDLWGQEASTQISEGFGGQAANPYNGSAWSCENEIEAVTETPEWVLETRNMEHVRKTTKSERNSLSREASRITWQCYSGGADWALHRLQLAIICPWSWTWKYGI